MMLTSSFTGLLKMLLLLIGAWVVLKFIGRLIQAKRALQVDRESKADFQRVDRVKRYVRDNEGKTQVLTSRSKPDFTEDIGHQEI